MEMKDESVAHEHAIEAANHDHLGKGDLAAKGRNVDTALQFVLEHEDVTWTESEERRVRWKIDLIVLPLLFLAATLGQGDSQAYGFAALFGLVKDLQLYTIKFVHGTIDLDLSKYSFSAGIASLGAAAGQWPLLFIAQYVSYGKFNGIMVTYAGLVAILVIVCHDFSEIMALRFFSGFATVVSPLSIIITSMWWKTDEQPVRMGIFIMGAALGNLVGQGIDFGAISIGGAYAKEPWKWIYVLLGAITMTYGIIVLTFLPAYPMKAWFLNERERVIATRRLQTNNTGIQTRKFKLNQVFDAIKDPQLYLLCIYAWSFNFVNSALGSFLGFLVTSFGYSQRRALLLSMPASAIAAVCMGLSGLLGTVFPRRRIVIAITFILPSVAGAAILWKAPRDNEHALLAGLYLLVGFYGALVQLFALLAGNVAGHTKKTVINASIATLSNLGGFAGPWAYKGNQQAEGFPTGQITSLALLATSCVAFAVLQMWYMHCNKKKAGLREAQPELVDDPNFAFADMTDRENPVFQYVY